MSTKKSVKKQTKKSTKTKNNKKTKRKETTNQPTAILQNEKIRIIITAILALIIIVAGIWTIVSQNKQLVEEENQEFVTESSNDGDFTIENIQNGTEKVVTLKLTNKTENTKEYNLEVLDLINELNDTAKLKYDLFINNQQEIFDEIFPIEDMLILDGAEVKSSDTIELKIVIKYQNNENQNDLGKTITGKFKITESNVE